MATAIGGSPDNMIYSFDLGQYGLVRRAGETYDAYMYMRRVQSSTFAGNTDNASYDLSIDGAAELNAFIGRSTRTVYASWAT